MPLLTACRACQVAPGLGIDVTNVDTGDIECAVRQHPVITNAMSASLTGGVRLLQEKGDHDTQLFSVSDLSSSAIGDGPLRIACVALLQPLSATFGHDA